MKRTLLIIFLLGLLTPMRAQTTTRTMAVTIDDLPYVNMGGGSYLTSAQTAARGYTFVTLDKVMADPAYQTKDTVVSKFGPSWLWRWMKSKGMDVDFAGDPEPAKWVMDLYNQRR